VLEEDGHRCKLVSQRLDEGVKRPLVNAWQNTSTGNEVALFLFFTINKLEALNLAEHELI